MKPAHPLAAQCLDATGPNPALALGLSAFKGGLTALLLCATCGSLALAQEGQSEAGTVYDDSGYV